MVTLRLRRWTVDDIDLLRAANTAEMTRHLNGPESEEQLEERNLRYLRLMESGEARVFAVVHEDDRALGSIGYWRLDWRGESALETGWFVRPEAQRQGVASAALTMLIDDARLHRGERRYLTAFPSVENAASNAVCRTSGLTLRGTVTEQFRGAPLTVNEWALDLAAENGR